MKVGSILLVDDFCGTTFSTPKGGVLTVVGIVGRSGSSKKYGLTCSVCHLDSEMFDEYFESTKSNLNNGRSPCGCAKNPRLNERQIKIKINRICKEKNYKFIGFVGDSYINSYTKLILSCPIHRQWDSTIYRNFIRESGAGCPRCGIRNTKQKQKLSEEDAITNIQKVCTEKNYKFISFVGGSYEGNETKLILECPTHGQWDSTTYASFTKENGCGCPSCGGSKKLTQEEAITNIQKVCTEKNLKFIAFVGDSYVGVNQTKLILECPIHGQWDSTIYRNFINENGRGCPSCSTTGYDKSKPGTFYIIHYECGGRAFLKYGITNRAIEERMLEHYKGMQKVNATILKEYYFKDGTIPSKMEQAVNTKYKGGVTTALTSGNTETFNESDYNDVLNIIENYKTDE